MRREQPIRIPPENGDSAEPDQVPKCASEGGKEAGETAATWGHGPTTQGSRGWEPPGWERRAASGGLQYLLPMPTPRRPVLHDPIG